MQNEHFLVRNVKCGGCADNIRHGLQQMGGIASIEVDVDTGAVSVSGDMLVRHQIAAKLSELGYPEKD